MKNKSWTLTNNQPVMTRVLGKKKDEDFTDEEKELLKKAIDNYLEDEA